MNRATAFLAALAILPFAGLAACGSGDSDGSSASANTTTTAAAETTAAAPAATTAAATTTTTPSRPTTAQNAKALATCHKVLDPFVVQLRAIDREVAAGPNYKRYSTLANRFVNRHAKVGTAMIPSASCETEVNMQIAGARLLHGITVLNWTKCRKDGNCRKAMPGFRKSWRQARRLTKAAAKGFKNVTAGS